ncbi:sporulation protein YqfD [Halothermothrix orenii]|uniref:Putative stage IV sporulation YqfD n=1 Tax=Halothermothrix orenii (strain H 168 / OCM 544 / DSM 9562) TaxID=373903 RepID=B8CXJ2_HALOH|nr:sporulation protein YqfD [Halothermothrix orenii]ACL70011.1 putative stage IV sporulation YqfD [Halothermothrix orenii H 168]
MLRKIMNFIQGYLLIEITGNALERFINQIIEKEIILWDVKRENKSRYLAKIDIKNFNKLRPLVRKRMCRVRIMDKCGLPFLITRAKQNYFLLVGFLILFLILYVGSNFLLFIGIEGLEKIPEERIINILKEEGVRPGILKNRVNPERLESIILKEEPRLAWVDVKWQGSRLFIETVEKKIVEKTEPGHLIAAKSGVIKEIIVLKGKAVVEEGDTVLSGQPLIIKRDKNERARGIVRAYVWYEAEGKVPVNYKEVKYTGKSKTIYRLKFGEYGLSIPWNKPDWKSYRIRKEIKSLPEWRNLSIPIELIREEYRQIKYVKGKRSYKTALFLAKEKALKKILREIDSGTIILNVNSRVIETKNENVVKIKLLIQTEENIAKITDEEGPGGSD